MIGRIKNLIKQSKNPEGYIDIVFCMICGKPRTNLEWENKKIINCMNCGSNRITGGATSMFLKIKLLIRYIVKGF
jgi:DNA-directed RNA polymerase subunit RPC12/RpoP